MAQCLPSAQLGSLLININCYARNNMCTDYLTLIRRPAVWETIVEQ